MDEHGDFTKHESSKYSVVKLDMYVVLDKGEIGSRALRFQRK